MGSNYKAGKAINAIGFIILSLTLPLACSQEDSNMSTSDVGDVKDISLKFTKSLTDRDYATAYSMTSEEFKSQYPIDQLRENFETIVPRNWETVGPIEVGEVMQEWSTKKTSDRAWIYVSIGGDVYSEAISVILATENGALKIREVEYGRP